MFWHKFLAPELLFPSLKNSDRTIITTHAADINTSSDVSDPQVPPQMIINTEILNTKGKRKGKNTTKKPKKKSKSRTHVYLCKHCHKNIPDITDKFEENSISCELCNMWFHYVPEESESWICSFCKKDSS